MFRKFRQFCCCLFCGFFCFPILFKYKLLKIEKGKVVLAWTSASTYSVVAVSFVIWSLVRVQLWRNKLNWPNKQKTRWWEVIRKKNNFYSLQQAQTQTSWSRKELWNTSEAHDSQDIFHQNSSRLLLESRSCVRDVSTSSVGLLPSCLPPLLLTLTVPLSLSFSPTTAQEQQRK